MPRAQGFLSAEPGEHRAPASGAGRLPYNRRIAATGHYHGLYLGDPDIDFVKLAESQDVRGRRVTSAAEIAPAIARATEETRAGNSFVLEVVVGRVGGGADSTWHQQFSAARGFRS